jgi:hypothetical protein
MIGATFFRNSLEISRDQMIFMQNVISRETDQENIPTSSAQELRRVNHSSFRKIGYADVITLFNF